MNLQKIIRNAKITLGLTWYNFISEKPDLSMIMNGLGDDKYIPVASPPVIPSFRIIATGDNSRNKYFREMAEQERALRQTLSAIGFPNGYDFGASAIEMHYAPDARISTMPSEPERMINNHVRYSSSFQPRSGNKHHLTRLLYLESQKDSIIDSDKPKPDSIDSVELDFFRPDLLAPGISEFEPKIHKRTEGIYGRIGYKFGDPKKPSGAA